jgi:dTDP-4-amino-4,6-dideoxygalactose transaminase
VPLARPSFDHEELEALGRVLQSGWVSQGPEVAAFERELAAVVGAPHACAVSSGTAALALALRAVGVEPGTEVVTVSHSFIATANAVRMVGALPVFVDVDRSTGNLDPTHIEGALNERTRAVLCVHQLGLPCDLAAICEVAAGRGVPVVEDAACALGSEIRWHDRWEAIGRPHGAIACFSFHGRKVITTGEGGMVTTADPEIDARVRRWRQHGMTIAAEARHTADRVILEEYQDIGFNYRMSDLAAAVGRVQLRKLPALVARRRELAARYDRTLAGAGSQVTPTPEPCWARSNRQSYAVRLDVSVDVRVVMQELLDHGIVTRPGVMCAHLEPAYQAAGTWRCAHADEVCWGEPGRCTHLSASEACRRHSLLLPLYPELADHEVDRIVAALLDVGARKVWR